ncbi:MAG: hypothetical protein Q9162_004610 [Coniocarpon cinnabarinum]
MSGSEPQTNGDTHHLRDVLLSLHSHPFPTVQGPSTLDKRASVALILRINPRYPDHAEIRSQDVVGPEQNVSAALGSFFEQDWVIRGEAEVLFIKRAARQGDRWQGHIALPGGKQDAGDADDEATAVRETQEEIGIDLRDDNAIAVGNLPQRVVTTSWGKVPLMVLCPYVFLLMDPNPVQTLQPTEIASTHWVPLRALLTPSLRTQEHQDVSSRLAKQEFGIKRWFLRLMLGQMMFSAIRLIPSESRYCISVPSFLPEHMSKPTAPSPPLLLWGLTLGVCADFLDLVPPHNALGLWTYPTFSPPDVRFVIWAMSFHFRRRKQAEVQSGRLHSPAGVELGLDAINPNHDAGHDKSQPEAGISGNSIGSRAWLKSSSEHGFNSSAIGTMLEGYYDIVRRGVAVTLAARSIATLVAVMYVWKRRRMLIP